MSIYAWPVLKMVGPLKGSSSFVEGPVSLAVARLLPRKPLSMMMWLLIEEVAQVEAVEQVSIVQMYLLVQQTALLT